MTIPDYQNLMRPVLEMASNRPWPVSEAVEAISDKYGLTEDERAQLLPKGGTTVIRSRLQWAVTYLVQAGCMDRPKRGVFQATKRGKDLLALLPGAISNSDLEQFDEFVAFKSRKKTHTDSQAPTATSGIEPDTATPEERIRLAHEQITEALASELISRVKSAPPEFFERLILKLLKAMGYGGEADEAHQHIGKSSDGGVDGLINEDTLGLERVYIQAKRYSENPVSASEIRDFFGALDRFRAAKGVLVTTSRFTREAIETAGQLSKRIVLIDGARLANLMIDYNVGVREKESFVIKWIDDDDFSYD